MTPLSVGDDVAGLGELAIAAALDREIDDHRARPHRAHHLGAEISFGAGRPGISAVVMTMSCLAIWRGDQRRLLGLVGVRHFLGVAAGGLGLLELLVLDGDEFGAERFDLFLGRRPHVGRGDDRAEAARRGDRLQAGDADAHDEDFRRRHGAGRASSSSAARGRIRRPRR